MQLNRVEREMKRGVLKVVEETAGGGLIFSTLTEVSAFVEYKDVTTV